jgi:hypothetical protein
VILVLIFKISSLMSLARHQISVVIGRRLGEKSRCLGENSRCYFPAGAALIGTMDIGSDGMIAGFWPAP